MNAAEAWLETRRRRVAAEKRLRAIRERKIYNVATLIRVEERLIEELTAAEAKCLVALESRDRWEIDPDPAYAIVRIG